MAGACGLNSPLVPITANLSNADAQARAQAARMARAEGTASDSYVPCGFRRGDAGRNSRAAVDRQRAGPLALARPGPGSPASAGGAEPWPEAAEADFQPDIGNRFGGVFELFSRSCRSIMTQHNSQNVAKNHLDRYRKYAIMSTLSPGEP